MHGERTVQAAAIKWLGSLGWTVLDGPDITPDTPRPERSDYGEVVVHGRLRSAPARLGPDLPDHALDDSLRQLTRPGGARLAAGNGDVHRMLVAGVKVEYAHADDGLGVPAAYRAAPTTTIICDHSDSYKPAARHCCSGLAAVDFSRYRPSWDAAGGRTKQQSYRVAP